MWTVVYDYELPSQGLCHSEDKKILVGIVPQKVDELRTLLIHEICHSSAFGHGKRWSGRMLEAAERAEKAGWLIEADLVRAEVEMYRKSPKITASLVNEQISDCLIENPNVSYENVIAYLASEYGMYVGDFEKRYKSCRKVYDKARIEQQERLRLRQSFGKLADN